MRNGTHEEIERIAGNVGWDSFTLLLLISRWAEEKDLSRSLLEYLTALAVEEEGEDQAR
jgi:hypothetical protein